MKVSATSPEQAWKGKTLQVTVVGKSHLNSVLLEEQYEMDIVETDFDCTLADIVSNAIQNISNTSMFPADLVEELSFKFIKT